MVRMSESPKKNRLTPAQNVRFVEIARSVKPIKKEAKVVIPRLVFFFWYELCRLLIFVVSSKNKTAAKAVEPEASDESEGDVFKCVSYLL